MFFLGCKKDAPENSAANEKTSENITSAGTNKTGKSDIHTYLGRLRADIPGTGINAPKMIDVTFTALDGTAKKLSDYKGQVILLNLWATWCPPCRAEMPAMEQLYAAYKEKGFVIAAVSVGEDAKTVKDFLKKTPYSFPVFTDPEGQVSGTYGTGSIPTTYLIDKEGTFLGRFVGAREWYSEDAQNLIEALLAR